MLKILDETQEEFGTIVNNIYSEYLRTKVNGKLGGNDNKLIYLKNDDPNFYYTNIVLKPTSTTYDDISGEFGETGFGLKVLYGERQPTEMEWDQVASGEAIQIPNIGNLSAADISNYYPIWVRIIVPGMTYAQNKQNISLKLTYKVNPVGS